MCVCIGRQWVITSYGVFVPASDCSNSTRGGSRERAQPPSIVDLLTEIPNALSGFGAMSPHSNVRAHQARIEFRIQGTVDRCPCHRDRAVHERIVGVLANAMSGELRLVVDRRQPA